MFFTRQVGGLPTWGWFAVGAALILVIIIVAAAAASTAGGTSVSSSGGTSGSSSGGSSIITVMGNVVKARSDPDTEPGVVYLQKASLAAIIGQSVVAWSFYASKNTNYVTPVLVEEVVNGTSATYYVRGIGASAKSAETSAPQTYDFDVSSGSNVIQNGNYYVGHYDGRWDSTGSYSNPGAIEFDNITDTAIAGQIMSDGIIRLGTTSTIISLDGALTTHVGTGADVTSRTYSVQFSASA